MDKTLLSATLTILLAVIAACSVKEDRSLCPCYLQVTFSEPDTTGRVELLGWNRETLFHNRVRIEDCRPSWNMSIKRGTFVLSACKGIGRSTLDGHQICIPMSCEADSLYAYFEEVDATGDFAYAEVSLRKQFATVFLDIRKTEEEIRSFRFLVDGNTSGFDVLDYSPVRGPFHCEPVPGEGERLVTFRIPRQIDDGLKVTIMPKGAYSTRFPLGEYIRQLGYNWNTEELQDIYVSIDLVRGLVNVSVEDWEEGMQFPLVEI